MKINVIKQFQEFVEVNVKFPITSLVIDDTDGSITFTKITSNGVKTTIIEICDENMIMEVEKNYKLEFSDVHPRSSECSESTFNKAFSRFMGLLNT